MKQRIDLAEKLIKLKTVDGNHSAFEQAWYEIDSVLDTYKYKRYMANGYESRVYYSNGQFPKSFDVILNGHLDIVAGDDDLFKPTIIGDKLYGRGAYDMKAALAVEIYVFKQLAQKLPIKMGLQITTDEEIGGHNGVKYQFNSGLKAKFGLSAESGSNFAIKTQAKGIYWLKINFKGVSSHAAQPWSGTNSLYQISSFLTALNKSFPVPKQESWVTTVTPSNLESNNPSLNKIPDRASLYLDVRFVPEDEHSVLNTIKKLLPSSAQLDVILSDGAHNTPANHPQIKHLQHVCKDFGIEAPLTKSHGTGDMRFYTLNQTPAIEFGPIGGNAHNSDEWVSLESLERFSKLLITWLKGTNHE